jgi:hypothetical protein
MQDQNETQAATSWAPQVRVAGETKFVGNQLRFATEDEAKQQVHNLMMRWLSVEDTRVVATADPVNYRWIDGKLERLPVPEQVPA